MPDDPRRSWGRAELAQFLGLALSFAPWLTFMLIARDSHGRVVVGLIVGLVLAVGLGLAKINKGIILWMSLAFFAYATIAIAVLNDQWTLRYLGVLANGVLAAVMWATVLVGKPFTLEYAKEHTEPSLWTNPGFVHSNNIISGVWAASISLNAALAFAKVRAAPAWEVVHEVISYAALLAAILFTIWYPKHVRRKRAS